ncbi:MAG: sulfurtransferase TusA family protein [Magnetococcales bacterium]|nr:sulfurtransferase TusA family protein [Magnetococcales bacterium]
MPDDEFIDITTEQCPMTFVRVKLKLESMQSGRRLLVRLNRGEPLINVPRSLQDEHYQISQPQPDGEAMVLLVTKP